MTALKVLIGFAKAGENIPVRVDISPDEKGERWVRHFGEQHFRSYLSLGAGQRSRLLTERFGACSFDIALIIEDDQSRFVPRSWRCLGIPMPKFLLPGGDSFETTRDGRFYFDVTITVPLIGQIVRYKGWLFKKD